MASALLRPAELRAQLHNCTWRRLRDLCRQLALPIGRKTSCASFIARIMEVYADPARAREVMGAVFGEPSRKRARTDSVVQNLEAQFDAVAAVAAVAGSSGAAAVEAAALDDDVHTALTTHISATTEAVSMVAESPGGGSVPEVTSRRQQQQQLVSGHGSCGGGGVVQGVPAIAQGVPATVVPHDIYDSPAKLIYVPTALCPWQPSPMQLF